MPVLENASYGVQAAFWVATSSAVGAGIGIATEAIKQKVRRAPKKRVRSNEDAYAPR